MAGENGRPGGNSNLSPVFFRSRSKGEDETGRRGVRVQAAGGVVELAFGGPDLAPDLDHLALGADRADLVGQCAQVIDLQFKRGIALSPFERALYGTGLYLLHQISKPGQHLPVCPHLSLL